jgi:hypothetical protein
MSGLSADSVAVRIACERLAAANGVSSHALRRLMALNAMKGVPTNPRPVEQATSRADAVPECDPGWNTRLWQIGDTRVDYDAITDRLRVCSGGRQTVHEWSEVVSPADCTLAPLRSMRLYWHDDVWRRLA